MIASRLVRAMLIVGGAVGLSLASVVFTSADTGVSHSGLYGVHELQDSAEYPGVTCLYDRQAVISGVRVRAPYVYARSRTNGIDSGLVSWQVQLQASTASGWSTVATSAIQRRTATDHQVADFETLSRAFHGSGTHMYRVNVIMRWYNRSGAIVGRAGHRVDWYSWQGVPSFKGSCPGALF